MKFIWCRDVKGEVLQTQSCHIHKNNDFILCSSVNCGLGWSSGISRSLCYIRVVGVFLVVRIGWNSCSSGVAWCLAGTIIAFVLLGCGAGVDFNHKRKFNSFERFPTLVFRCLDYSERNCCWTDWRDTYDLDAFRSRVRGDVKSCKILVRDVPAFVNHNAVIVWAATKMVFLRRAFIKFQQELSSRFSFCFICHWKKL